MDDQNERPGLFYMLWPSITFINCPKCSTHWVEPRFSSADASFPPSESACDKRESLERPYCPRCGNRLPSMDELDATEHAVGRPPIKDKPFIGTVSGIKAFLERSNGATVQLWKYDVSLSNLILMIKSPTDDSYAFVACTRTQTLMLPKTHWKSSLVLQSTDAPDYWALRDGSAGVEIIAAAIGVFHDLKTLS